MSFLDHINSLNRCDLDNFRPFTVGDTRVGWLKHEFAEKLARWTDVFDVSLHEAVLSPALTGFDQRSDAVAAVISELVTEGVIGRIHGEMYPVTDGDRDEALFVIDRASAPYFGIRAFGQHLNGFVRDRSGIKLWMSRRANHRVNFPGRLDNMVAGGLPYGVSLADNLAKECWEEAAVPADLAARAVAVSTLFYRHETPKGMKPDTLYCYDLEVPVNFVPHCTDGENEAFYLMPAEEVAALVCGTDALKPNCNLVVIDFLVRHGFITDSDEDYEAIRAGLYTRLEPVSGGGG